MKVFTIIACILVSAVIGILSDSEELSSDALDCLEELHPLSKQAMKHYDMCKEEFPRPPENFNEDGLDMALGPHEEDRWKCYNEFHTPEIQAKLQDLEERCRDTVTNIPDSQRDKVEKLMKQDEWSRG